MFGFISKKRLIEVVLVAYFREDTKDATDKIDFYYRSGNANALEYLCYRLGLNLTEEVKKANARKE